MPIDKELLYIVRSNDPTITFIDFSFNKIGDADFKDLMLALKDNKTLTAINLSGNQISAVGAKDLALALKVNKNLTVINLKGNRISATGTKDLAMVLKVNKTITTIDLGGNEIGAAGAKDLALALKENQALTSIDLHNNKIGDIGIEDLALALKENKILTAINLSANQIGAVGAKDLALALKVNKTLTTIDLGGNEIGAAGAKDLALALKENRTLTSIDLYSNKIGDMGAENLVLALKFNKTLTNLSVLLNEVDFSLDKKIAEIIDNNKKLKHEFLLAVQQNYFFKLRELLAEGVSINSINDNRMTALHLAAEKGYFELVKFLISQGANIHMKNKDNKTALDIAKLNQHQPVVDYLYSLTQSSSNIPIATILPPVLPTAAAKPASANEFDIPMCMQKANALYEEGNYAEAVKWYHKAAIQGDAIAEKRVMVIEKMLTELKVSPPLGKQEKSKAEEKYKKGERYFMKKDYEKALKYYKRAAKDNYAGSKEKVKEVQKLLDEQKNKPVMTSSSSSFHSSHSSSENLRHSESSALIKKEHSKPMISIEVPSSEFTLGEKLGEGGFGTVYQGQWQYTTVAIKKISLNKMSPEALEEFIHEAQLMSQIRHQHVVSFYKVCIEPNNYAIIMEYCEKGSLYSWLKLPEAESWDIRLQISLDVGKGLCYLHQHQLLHRDLKSLNVLLDKHLTAKISDFGLSKVKSETASTSSSSAGTKGTLRWLAPELVSGEEKHHSEKTDVYAYGMVLWEIVARKVPFQEQHNEMMIGMWIAQGKTETIPANTPPSLAKLIGQCWDKRAKQRPSARAAVEALGAAQKANLPTSSKPALSSTGYQGNLASEQKANTTSNNSDYRKNLMS